MADMVADMVANIKVDMVADTKVDMVADMEVDNGLGAFASPNFFKPTLSRLAHLLSFASLFVTVLWKLNTNNLLSFIFDQCNVLWMQSCPQYWLSSRISYFNKLIFCFMFYVAFSILYGWLTLILSKLPNGPESLFITFHKSLFDD